MAIPPKTPQLLEVKRNYLLRYSQSGDFKRFIIDLSDKQYKLLLDVIEKIREQDNTASDDFGSYVKKIEKGFDNGINLDQDEKNEVIAVWKRFEEEMQHLLTQSCSKSEIHALRGSKVDIVQLFGQLRETKDGFFDRLIILVEAKTGLDLNDPMKSVSKIFSGDEKDESRSIKDSDASIGMGGLKSFVGSEMLGSLLGFSALASVGFLAPVIVPLYIMHKVVPSALLPLIGGLQVDHLLAEGTAWNPTTKDTKTLIGKSDGLNSHSRAILLRAVQEGKGGTTGRGG